MSREQELLSHQVMSMMDEESNSSAGTGNRRRSGNRAKKKKNKALKVFGILCLILLLAVGFLLGTSMGRSILYKEASKFVYKNVDKDTETENKDDLIIDHAEDARDEDYIMNYLIFGIEEIGGGANTDTMMIATINTKDDTVKLTSLLRDSYVDIPGYKWNKLNSAYPKGGVKLLIETIEHNFKIHIDGYASVNFESFEKVIDMLGGVTIELGEKEAKYLNRTNYISKKENRNVKPGVNKLNGNQALGYVRVRKEVTLGGVNNDYGRAVRQQRVLKALFESYVSPKNLLKLASTTKQTLGYVKTNLSQKQIEDILEAIVENKITTLETFRIPVDGAFESPKKHNGIGYPLVLNWEKNRIELYKFIYGDTEEEARKAIEAFVE